MNIKKLVNQYMKSPAFTHLADSSKRSYDYALRTLEDHFRDKDILEIRRSDMIKFVNTYVDKPAFANLSLRVASVLFSFAMDIDALPFNPADRIKKFKIGSHSRWYEEDVKTAIRDHDRVISTSVMLAWYTGQREEDILNMRWSDLRQGHVHLVQGKTKLEMEIKAHPDMIAGLLKFRGNEPDHYFIVSGAKPLSGQAFRGRFKRAMTRLGISKVFHGIRKGVASSLAEKGRSTTEIAAILGHKTTRMAEYYAEQACGKKLASNAVDAITSCV